MIARPYLASKPLMVSPRPAAGRVLHPRRPVLARAEEGEVEEIVVVPLPKGVTEPKKNPEIPAPIFGFVDYAERINSRVAMIGFIGILIVELFANKGILQLAGLKVGTGLGFEI